MEREIMSKQDLHTFGLEVLVGWLEKNGYQVEFVNPVVDMLPSVFANRFDGLTVIAAQTTMYPERPQFNENDKPALMEVCKELNAKLAFAGIGLVNGEGIPTQDKELMGKAYKDAKFMADFGGLKYIE